MDKVAVAFISAILCTLIISNGTEGRSLPSISEEILIPIDVTSSLKETESIVSQDESHPSPGQERTGDDETKDDEEFYVYYPLAIVNGTVEIVGQPVLYKASQLMGNGTAGAGRRVKRQFGINLLTAALGGALGGGAGGLAGSTLLAPLGPLGSAVGGGVGAGLGAAIGAGLGGGGPGGFLLGGAGGATFGSIGGLILGPVGATVLGLVGGGLGGALGAIG